MPKPVLRLPPNATLNPYRRMQLGSATCRRVRRRRRGEIKELARGGGAASGVPCTWWRSSPSGSPSRRPAGSGGRPPPAAGREAQGVRQTFRQAPLEAERSTAEPGGVRTNCRRCSRRLVMNFLVRTVTAESDMAARGVELARREKGLWQPSSAWTSKRSSFGGYASPFYYSLEIGSEAGV